MLWECELVGWYAGRILHVLGEEEGISGHL